jgi:hypothetical protein
MSFFSALFGGMSFFKGSFNTEVRPRPQTPAPRGKPYLLQRAGRATRACGCGRRAWRRAVPGAQSRRARRLRNAATERSAMGRACRC